MNPNNSNDSLDQQVDRTFRRRGRTRFWTAIVAAGSLLISTLAGCFAKDIRAMHPMVDDFRPKAAAFENNLSNIAATLGIYDAATSTYDADKVKAEAEKQLESDPNPNSITGYKNLTDYNDVDHLLATRYALDKVIEQNKAYIKDSLNDAAKKAEVDRRKQENEDLEKLRKGYDEGLRVYNEFGAAAGGRSDKDVIRCSLALGLEYYGEGTKKGYRNWKAVTQDRTDNLGTYVVGEPDDLEYAAIRNFKDLERAVNNREGKIKRNGKVAFWTTVGALVIGLLADGDEEEGGGETGGPGGIGGETGGPGGY